MGISHSFHFNLLNISLKLVILLLQYKFWGIFHIRVKEKMEILEAGCDGACLYSQHSGSRGMPCEFQART